MSWNKRSAYIFMRTAPGAAKNVWEKCKTWEKVIGSWIVTGDWDVVAWIDAASWDDVYGACAEIRNWEGVSLTSSHFVYEGIKNGHWWWEKPAGTWVFVRDAHLNGRLKKIKEWPWVVSAVSLPGSWDYLLWVWGDKWEDVWTRIWELNQSGFQTLTKVPIQSWWNQSWKSKWWEKVEV